MVDWEGEGKVMPDFKKLEAGQHVELPKWAERQKKVFTNWINNKVSERSVKVQPDGLFLDLQDGVVLYNLLEVLSKQSLAVLGKVKPEKNKIKKIANMNIVWKYLGNTVRLVGIGPNDIVDGHPTLTLGMIWSLIVFFMAKDLGDAGESLQALKKRIMNWVKKRTKNFPDVNVTNFTDSFTDGKAFNAILNDANPEEFPYDPDPNPTEALSKAFRAAEKLYGVGSILDPNDPHCCGDEKANITYLAELMKAMPDIGETGDDDTAAPFDVKESALKWAEQHEDDWLRRLKELCKFKPDEAKECAQKVADLMGEVGLQNIVVLTPGSKKEDPSLTCSLTESARPLIMGERAGPPGAPTVLLYATYATDDVEPGDAQKWANDPFTAVVEKDRLVGKGVFADKVNIAAPLAAIEALLSAPEATELPCTLKVLIGASPPKEAQSGDKPMEVCDALATFIKAHPGEIGNPEFVLVSEPGGSPLAPEKAAVMYGCRGFASMDVVVHTFIDQDDEKRRCADYGGPLLDPSMVLVGVLASLRDSTTGGVLVEALKHSPDADTSAKLQVIQFGEHHIRPTTGYHPEVPCARETYDREDMRFSASIVEQLTLLPAITITSLQMGNPTKEGSSNGPLSSCFSSTARASLHLCLAPNQSVADAVKAVQNHCTSVAPMGIKIEFENVLGHAGWFTHPNLPIVETVLLSTENKCSGRHTTTLGSPSFQPLPAGFASALPASKVLSFGVNDGSAHAGGANEGVKLDDVKDFVRNCIALLDMVGNPPRKPKEADDRTAYATSKMDELEKRNAANQLRARDGNQRTHNPFSPPSPIGKPAGTPTAASASSNPLTPLTAYSPSNMPVRPYGGSYGEQNPPTPSITKPPTPTSHTVASSPLAAHPRPPSPASHGNNNRYGNTMNVLAGAGGGGATGSSGLTGSMHATEEAVLNEINVCRQNPAAYADKMEQLLSYFKGSVYQFPGKPPVVTTEGDKPMRETITVLRQTPPLQPIARVNGLDTAAEDHARDLAAHGKSGHAGTDGSNSGSRIKRYGQFMVVAGELISYFEDTAEGIVAQLLTSDGEKSRQNRRSLLGEQFKVAGLSVCKHPTVLTVCVVTLAGGFGPKPLDRACVVTCNDGHMSPDFERVYAGLPVPQLKEEIDKAIAAHVAVELDYKPGEVQLTITQADGAKQVMQCGWS